MENESTGQHIILVIILIFILFFSYCAIPLPEAGKSNLKISKKTLTRTQPDKKEETNRIQEDQALEKPDEINAEVLTVESQTPSSPETADNAEQPLEAPAGKDKMVSQPGVILMNNPKYKGHKKGIVQFTHKEHVEKYKIACGSCHHDEMGKPLELTIDDTPKGCIECHEGTEKPTGEKLGEKEKIAAYHFEALHANCIGCHKDGNMEKGDATGKGPAPTSCANCHPKK